jgi:hypothetical protein
MNRELVGRLIGLRYKLMWAKSRSRNGRIALFFIGYLLFLLIAGLVAAGGVGAGLAAVKSGQAGMIARVTLGGLYLSAIMWTLLLGFGMNAVFSETELRRYPLTTVERRLVNFFIGIVDPYWILVLLVDVGLAVGLYLFGAGSFGTGVLAALLLLASNYVLARTLAILVDRLASTRMGATLMLGLIMAVSMGPGALAPTLRHNPALVDRILEALRFTPPFAAADAMTAIEPAASYSALLLDGFWLLAFLTALVWVEKHPFRARVMQAKAAQWDSRFERIGALFGPANAAYVGFWLRFYARNNRVRTLYFLGLPLAAFLTYSSSRRGGPEALFIGALGAMPILSYMGTSRIAVNQYGYTGGGFRRFFLLPAEPGASLRAASYAAVLMGAGMLPLGVLVWLLVSPGGPDGRQAFMLLCSGVTGLFVFNGLGVWSTLYGPRKGNYASAVGNDLSFAGNVVLLGSVLIGLVLPQLAKRFTPAAVSPENWAFAVIPVGVAYGFYKVSLALAAPRVFHRREELMKIVEGKL